MIQGIVTCGNQVNVPVPDKRKLSFYLPDSMLREMQVQAERLERPISWLIHRAWRIAYRQMRAERMEKEIDFDS